MDARKRAYDPAIHPSSKKSWEEGWTRGSSPRVTLRRRGKGNCGWRAVVALVAAVDGFSTTCMTAFQIDPPPMDLSPDVQDSADLIRGYLLYCSKIKHVVVP
jgi:hypothetical protein